MDARLFPVRNTDELERAIVEERTLNAAATGSPAPVYQWRLNGFDLAGATNASLTVTNFQSANEGNYTVVASNSTGTAASAPGLHCGVLE